MNHQVKLRSKDLVEIAFHCEKILEEEKNEMNITAKSTHLIILLMCKFIQDHVESDMNGTGDKIFLFFAKMSYFIMMRVVKRTRIFLFQWIHTSYQIWDIYLFCVFSSHWGELGQKYICKYTQLFSMLYVMLNSLGQLITKSH